MHHLPSLLEGDIEIGDSLVFEALQLAVILGAMAIMAELAAGELYVVPKGIEHKPYAKKEVPVTAHRASRGHQYRGCRRRVHRTE